MTKRNRKILDIAVGVLAVGTSVALIVSQHYSIKNNRMQIQIAENKLKEIKDNE